ncbi:hypothetical protein [Aureimonas mangrovi]|uniref:hypothetical protein n=1 Tax=Aureimonas mangrovi TaxID=2758041 RepID=UPI001FE362F6|nr:hypothetical protein [Aureimonas mangrovi]
MTDPMPVSYTTTHFRTLGWAGALLFTLAPPAFLYELYLFLYTTAPETNPTIGLFITLSAILSFASVPMMVVGRRERHSTSPTTARGPLTRRGT